MDLRDFDPARRVDLIRGLITPALTSSAGALEAIRAHLTVDNFTVETTKILRGLRGSTWPRLLRLGVLAARSGELREPLAPVRDDELFALAVRAAEVGLVVLFASEAVALTGTQMEGWALLDPALLAVARRAPTSMGLLSIVHDLSDRAALAGEVAQLVGDLLSGPAWVRMVDGAGPVDGRRDPDEALLGPTVARVLELTRADARRPERDPIVKRPERVAPEAPMPLHHLFACLTERQERIVEMRSGGSTWEEITRACGFSASTAKREMERLRKRLGQSE